MSNKQFSLVGKCRVVERNLVENVKFRYVIQYSIITIARYKSIGYNNNGKDSFYIS